MYQRVKQYIMENRMIVPGMTVIAGVSGGGDSMAMLDMLIRFQKECAFSLKAVHVHHGIRGAEADRDCEMVKDVCGRQGIPLETFWYDVPALSKVWKTGLEETARLVRKEAFAKACAGMKKNRARIALAHHRGDAAETVIHHLARGSGLRGLGGLRPVSGEYIRPFLCLEKKEIDKYLKEHKLFYVTDSSNESDDYTRNRIRHHILPLLEQEVNAKAVQHIAEASMRIAKAQDYLLRQGKQLMETCQKKKEGWLLGEAFFEEDVIVQEYALLELFENLSGRKKDFSSVHIQETLELRQKQCGKKVSLPYGLCAKKQYDGVLLQKEPQLDSKALELFSCVLQIPGETKWGTGRFLCSVFPYQQEAIEEKKYTKWFDYDKIVNNLCVRTRKPGDYVVTDKSGTCKKLRRVMIDDKIPAELRSHLPLVAQENEILWLTGFRMSERFKITSKTKRVLSLQYQGGRCDE